jgi:2-polyprenyl-3-methyl-5-hydroxy-6-metoxy-1,4-benzoquinol methylase
VSLRRILFTILLVSASAHSQGSRDADVWRDFVEWARMQPRELSWPDGYRAKLIAAGLSPANADERIALIPKLASANPAYAREISIIGFDLVYRASTQDRFTLAPNAFLVSVTKDLKPGKALDVAMGQGRNAVFLASRGWSVTGIDLAEEGLKAAETTAAKAGLRIQTVKTAFEDFDYGKEQWDLIYFVYTDAPTANPAFVARIQAALKPGGPVLLDRPFRSLTDPEPGWPENEEDKVNAHLKAWAGMQIIFYEDTTGVGDWRQTKAPRLEQKLRIVRVLARKR